MAAFIEKNANELFDKWYKRISEESDALKRKQIEERQKKIREEGYEKRVQIMDDFIKDHKHMLSDLDNGLVRRLVDNIQVLAVDKLKVQFQSVFCMEQSLSDD